MNRIRSIVVAGILLGFASALPAVQSCNLSIPESTPLSDFTDNADDGTVTHVPTGLMWKRCAEGQVWSGGMCTGTPSTTNWATALQMAAASSSAGHTDWRLPNIKELHSIVEARCFSPAVNSTVFVGTENQTFVSSSASLNSAPQYAWGISFYNGSAAGYGKGNTNFRVRLVRAGQAYGAFDRQDTVALVVSRTGIGTIASGSLINCGSTCSASVGRGFAVTLAATPAENLIAWGGACTGTAPTCTVTVDAAKSVTASFKDVPGAPTGVSATGSDARATVTFIAPASDGGAAISTYTATSNPGGFTGTCNGPSACGITVNGLANGTAYYFRVTANNIVGSGSASDPSNSVTPKGGQTIGFGAAPSIAVGGTGTVSATGGASGNAVIFGSATTDVCTIAGSTVTGVTAGICTIYADQAGSAIYNAAPRATLGFNIGKANQSIVFGPAPTVLVGGTGTVSATATSGLAVSFASTTTGVCTIAGAMVSGISAGNCIVAADQAGNANFNAAPRLTQSFVVQEPSFALTVARAGAGAGTVISMPAGIDCGSTCSASFVSGASVTLTATPASGSLFGGWSGGGCSGAGSCMVSLSAATTVTATFALTADIPRLGNISTRMQVLTGNDVMIGGFVIGGGSPKSVVVRARGPSLVPFGITNALANPTLNLFSGQTVIATNDDWGSATNAAQITASGFAPDNALESAILTTLNPGAYTAIVSGVGNTTGVGIIEVFEVDHPEIPLANISTRGQVLTGNDVMIGGFIISGTSAQTVVVRARGPSLIPFGIANALANPVLQLFSGQTLVASNDDWGGADNAAAITASGFAPSDPLESAILITLQPGAYTAIVTGATGGTGVGIVEVFAR